MSSPRAVRLATLLAGAAVVVTGCSGTASQPGASSPSTTAVPIATGAPSTSAEPSTPAPQPPPVRLVARIAGWQLPEARSREVALSTAGGLVLAGGLSSAHVSTSTVWTLSATDGRVLHTGALAAAVHDTTGLVVHRVPYVIAGGNTTTVDDVQEISSGDTAQVVAHLPQPRSDLSAVSVGGAGYVLGGFDGTRSLSPVLRTADGRHFATVAQLRVTVRYAALAAVTSPGGDKLLVFGGEHDGVPVDDVQQVDLATGRTRIVGHLPHALAHEAAVEISGSVFLLGGRSNGQLQSAMWRWDATRHRAVAAGRLPYAVADAGATVSGSTAFVLGGETPEPTARVITVTAR
ncbi:MAG TPA: hypothetical protein VFJ17_06595 [Mycobacteriales bacterium]|jgi:hypothetical protein|nr:hypothetical protein [Mycobacteriales bacterium]